MKEGEIGGQPVILFLVFLILKLTGLVDWSWWWITLPLWIPPQIMTVVFLAVSSVVFSAVWLFVRLTDSRRVV